MDYSRQPSQILLGGLPQPILDFARQAAWSTDAVLLSGETGTGKTHLAKLIHQLSPLQGPFVRANCGELADSLFEREMFGHVRGAFTGATESKPGLFEAANGGTLFLDEIGELPLALQPKLLAVLDEKCIRRIGATRETPVDVRIIAATNSHLDRLVHERRFRADLYYRLAVLKRDLLPLRRRSAGIPEIARCLLAAMSSEMSPGNGVEISADALGLLQQYRWPGNIRELDNALRSAVFSSGGRMIEPKHLPEEIRFGRSKPSYPSGARIQSKRRYLGSREPTEERRLIIQALQLAKGNKTAAAKRLGMSRSTLWYKLQQHRIVSPLSASRSTTSEIAARPQSPHGQSLQGAQGRPENDESRV